VLSRRTKPAPVARLIGVSVTCALLVATAACKPASLVSTPTPAAPTERVALVTGATTASAPTGLTPTSPPPEGEFSIYLLAQDVSVAEWAELGLDTLELETEPLLTIDDIVTYRKETHEIELTPSAYERIEQLEVPISGLPFVVGVGRQPVYRGAFWTMLSSQSFDGVAIWVPLVEEFRLQIRLGYPGPSHFQGQDPRSDARILRSLEQTGKLK